MDARRILFISELRFSLNFPISDINEGGFVSIVTIKGEDGRIKECIIASDILTVDKTLVLMANRLNFVKTWSNREVVDKMEAYKIEGILLKAILDEKTVAVITINGKRSPISLSGIHYSGISKKENIVKLTYENKEEILLDCEKISSIKCL